MSRPAVKPLVAIIDSKNLRGAGIASLFEPWASSENLRLTSFTPDQAHEALRAKPKKFRMLIFTIGEASVAEETIRQQLKEFRAVATDASLVIISDIDDPQDIAAALSSNALGFIHSGITPELAYHALSFILHGGSYFPPSALRQRQMQPEEADKQLDGLCDYSESEFNHEGHGTNINGFAHSIDNYGTVNLTVREKAVLKHIRLGESNKYIARQLGMMEGTVKVHVRRLMRKFRALNRTQLALGRGLTTDRSAAEFVGRKISGTEPR